jgi:hypothetical protein
MDERRILVSALPWIFVLGLFAVSLVAAIVTTVVVWVERRRFPRPYGLLIVTVIIFSCFGYFFFFAQGDTQGKPVGYSFLQIKETDVADLAIQTIVTVPADTDQPVQVEVNFTSPEQSPSSSSSPSQLTPIGTPGVPIVKAFGSGYDFFATARLNASAFDVVPQEQSERSLDQPGAFDWALTPKYTGYQSIEVVVTGRWIPRSGGPAIERLLASQFFSVYITATPNPFFTLGRLDVTQLSIVFFVMPGLLLNVPWVVELLKKRPEALPLFWRRSARRQ